MTLLLDQGTTGLEEIQRETLLVLHESLNDAIADVEAYWGPRDADLAARLGVPYVPTTIERVAVENFHEGHRPSLIDAPVTRYPNASVMCFRATPAAFDGGLDQMRAYSNALWIEIMVKSEADEGECNRRVQRTATAVNLCILANKTLNGIVNELDTTPTINISDLFTRKERSSYGPHWFWQGARLEYAVRKEAVDPPSSTGSFFRPAQQFNIDQA